MAVVDSLYAGYGECAELCGEGSADHYCEGTGDYCQGVELARLVAEGDDYLTRHKPKLDKVKAVSVVEHHATTT